MFKKFEHLINLFKLQSLIYRIGIYAFAQKLLQNVHCVSITNKLLWLSMIRNS